MRIGSARIQNYGSLKDVSFEGQPLTVFIGSNGKGKSLIVEALHRFFAEFNPIAGGSSLAVSDILWHRRETGSPIIFEIEIILDESELKSFLPFDTKQVKGLLDFLGETYSSDEHRKVRIKRSLDISGNWKTDRIGWAGIPLVSDNAIITPDNLMGELSEIRRKGKREEHEEEAHARKEDLTIKVGLPIPLVTSENMQKIGTTMLMLRGKFKLIPAARDARSVVGQRTPLVDSPTLQSITSTSINRQRQQEIKWEKYRTKMERLLLRRLEPNPSQLLIKEGDLGLTVGQIGGGEQSLLGLVWETQDTDMIYAVEEPENHLYPMKQKELLDYFAEVSEDTQIFICTHSPVLASRPEIGEVYLVTKDEDGNTQVESVTETNVDRVIDELGIRARYQFDYDKVVFVEGEDDVQIFSAIARKVVKDAEPAIGFVDAGGWNNMDYYANARVLTSRRVKVGIAVIFDGDTEKEERNRKIKERLVKELTLDEEDIFTLKKQSIEDYILNAGAIRRAFPTIGLRRAEIVNIISNSRRRKNKKRVLDNILKRGGIGRYTGRRGAQIAQALTEREIDAELKKILKSIAEKPLDGPPEQTTEGA